jgi:hypothetical protein
MEIKKNNKFLNGFIIILIFLFGCKSTNERIGQNEAIRIYVEFADGSHRGMYDQETGIGGFIDEPYDATTAMVINWHKLPEKNPTLNAILEYRIEHPAISGWQVAEGDSQEFWHRDELINRVVLKNLNPNSVYAVRVKNEGNIFRFRTMPFSLEERPVKIVIASDHQSPEWNDYAHDNAKMVALIKPDMFLALGDFVNCEGRVIPQNANRWALYLDNLYNTNTGYFIYNAEIDGVLFPNMIIPHVAILGNHETGDKNHIRWPTCVVAGSSNLGFPQFTAANWMELLFHFPFRSEGFYSEFRPNHPNINKTTLQPGFGHGGFGKLSFSNYLLLIALDNSQNWEGNSDKGLYDWQGNPITDTWPWFETHYSDVRQDIWLNNLLEPENGPSAGEIYENIIPVWHRGLFGSARFNMSLKNRAIMEYWLPVLYRNGVKFFAEAHDHLYGRSIPMGISDMQPDNTYLEKVYYQPQSWALTSNLSLSYLDEFYSVNCIKNKNTHEITGWEYKDKYINYHPAGMRAFGYGGWAAGRRDIGHFGAGNAGWWFVDPGKGGEQFSGSQSFHINVIHLTPDGLITEAFDTSQLIKFQNGENPKPIHCLFWDKQKEVWSDQ